MILEVRPAVADGGIAAPPSKSYTHRALVAAYLSDAPTEVVHPLVSDDTRATRDGLAALGARVRRSARGWELTRLSTRPRSRIPTLNCRESGTTLRMLAATAALRPRKTRFTGAQSLARRPTEPLFEALRTLGADIRTPSSRSALPCTIVGPIHAGAVTIPADVSSQFASALLMVLPTLPGRSVLRLSRSVVSRPYIEATLSMLASRGVDVSSDGHVFRIPGNQVFRSGHIVVPGDASSAAYLWAAAAATGGRVRVAGIPRGLPQADLALLEILERMGAGLERTASAVTVEGPLAKPIDCDLSDSPDLVPLVAVLAALIAGGRSRLRGAPNLAYKESDRRAESGRLAAALGARVRVSSSEISVTGVSSVRPLVLPRLSDHRLVMSAAVAALAAPAPSRIGVAEAVRKSYPSFWRDLSGLTGGAILRP